MHETTTKFCSGCQKNKRRDAFYPLHGTNKVQSICKICRRAKNKERYHSDPERFRADSRKRIAEYTESQGEDWLRNRNLLRSFGITAKEYDRMLTKQKGLCAICKRPERSELRGKVKNLAVDHDHQTGKIRGLLCEACNRGIGLLQDNPETLKSALRYLRRNL